MFCKRPRETVVSAARTRTVVPLPDIGCTLAVKSTEPDGEEGEAEHAAKLAGLAGRDGAACAALAQARADLLAALGRRAGDGVACFVLGVFRLSV